MAFQMAMQAQGRFIDHEPLPQRGWDERNPSASQRVGRQRHGRKHWQPPDWLEELAGQAPMQVRPQGPVRGAGASSEPQAIPPRLLNERGDGHNWVLYEVHKPGGAHAGELLACRLCGCYVSARRAAAKQGCLGEWHNRPGLLQQRRRVQRLRHPSSSMPFKEWHLVESNAVE
eukprot:6460548-Amphidinium_carterae.1